MTTLALALVAVLVMAACSAAPPSGTATPGTGTPGTGTPGTGTPGTSPSEPGTTGQPTSAPSGDVVEGGTLTVAIQADLREADHMQARIAVDKQILGSTVFDPLFATNENGEPGPALAVSWEPSEDAKTWTIQLREGVKFHNGKDFTAEDVVENFEAFLDPEVGSNLAPDLGNIIGVEATGDHEVVFTLENAEGNFPAGLTDTAYIGDMDVRNEVGPEEWSRNPIGTGPYQWSARTPGDSITFVRFEDYWRGRPPLDTVVFQVLPDPDVATLELQNGGVDMIANYVSINALPALRNDPNIVLASLPGSTFYQIFLNMYEGRGYEDSEAARMGLAHLANMEELVPPIIGDFGSYANQPIPPWQVGHDPELEAIPYDPERGKQLLAEGGIPEGGTIKIVALNRPFVCDVATALQSQLVGLGYNVDLTCNEPEDLGPLLEYDWDYFMARTSGRALASVWFRDRANCELAIPGGVPNDYYTNQDCAINELIDEMLATTDEARYEELGKELSRKLILEADRVGMYWDTQWWAYRERVKGFNLSPIGYYGFLFNNISNVYIEE